MRQGIAVAGSILLDKIYGISSFPAQGELTQIKNISYAVGGCVPNVAIDLKKISRELPVYAIGTIGSDDEGRFIINAFSSEGVNTEGVVETDEGTSFTDVISVIGGQRTFFNYPGASSIFGVDNFKLPRNDIKMLHLGYFLLLDKIDNGDGVKILKMAQDMGIKTSIDLVSENSTRYSLVLPALPYVDNLIINETEAGMLTGIEPKNENLEKIAKRLMELGVKERVIIHKPDIGVCLSSEGFTSLPSLDLPDGFIKGTTGAGDAFCTGALYSIYHGKSAEEILEFASYCATCALRAPDATSGLENEENIINFCKKIDRKKICL